MVTPANQWRKDYEEGTEVELPSGKIVRLRSVSLQFMLRMKRLPDSLTGDALAAIGVLSPTAEDDKSKTAEAIVVAAATVDEYYEAMCRAAFASPRIVDDPKPDADEIAWDWIVDEDKEFVNELLQKPLAEWRRFHPNADASMEPVPTGKKRK